MNLLDYNGLIIQINKTKEYVQIEINNIISQITGTVEAYAGSTIPEGWLLCDGSAISRTTYADLFNVIGTTYGNGDGSSTFNLPNLINRFIQGSNTSGTIIAAGLPNITGSFNPMAEYQGSAAANLAFNYVASTQYGWGSGAPTQDKDNCLVGFDASRSNSIYGNSTTVQPPALTMKYIIKY